MRNLQITLYPDEFPYTTQCGMNTLIEIFNPAHDSYTNQTEMLKAFSSHQCGYLGAGFVVEITELLVRALLKRFPGLNVQIFSGEDFSNIIYFNQYLKPREFYLENTTMSNTTQLTVCTAPEWSQAPMRQALSPFLIPAFYDPTTAIYFERSSRDHSLFGYFDVFAWDFWCVLGVYYLLSRIVSSVQFIQLTSSRLISLHRAYLTSLAVTTMLFFGLYRGGLLSSILKNHDHVWFNSLKDLTDLLRSSKATLLITEGWYVSALSDIRVMRALQAHPPRMINKRSELLTELQKHPQEQVTFSSEYRLLSNVHHDLSLHTVRLSEMEKFPMQMYCALNHSETVIISYFNRLFSTRIDQMRSIVENYAKRLRAMNHMNRAQPFKRRLWAISFGQLKGSLLLLITGCALSMLIHFLELTFGNTVA